MDEMRHQVVVVMREIDTLKDYIRYYSMEDRRRALEALDDAESDVLKAKMYALGKTDA